jgi:GNAT superfamily N-acetyltransferase
MFQLTPAEASPNLRSLFDPDMPVSVRCYLVLDGTTAGQIFTDHPTHPTWGVVRELTYGSTFLGGEFDAALLAQIIAALRQSGDVVLLLHDDQYLQLLPPTTYGGFAIDFSDRPMGEGLDGYLQVPEGCAIRRADRALFERSVDRDANVAVFGSVETALEKWTGFFLRRGDEIRCEASAGPAAMGIVEVGVATPKQHQRQGYATITCAHLIQTCESMGYQTLWNAARQNRASLALARKLGYRKELEHQVLAWFKTV